MPAVVIVTFRVSGHREPVESFSASFSSLSGAVEARAAHLENSGLPEAWWFLEVAFAGEDAVEKAFKSVHNKLSMRSNEIAQIINTLGLDAEIDCTIKGDTDGLRMDINKESVALIAKLSASISFDLYPA